MPHPCGMRAWLPSGRARMRVNGPATPLQGLPGRREPARADMALVARGTERYELTATIVNALAHGGPSVDPEAVIEHRQSGF